MITNLVGEYRPVIWTMTPDSNGLYSLYIEGSLYKSHMTFDEFYPIYVRFVTERRYA